MEHELIETVGDEAGKAFDKLRREVTTLRLAVEKLADEPAKIVIPDYTETLEGVAEQMQATADQLANWAEKPALRLTPQALSDAIVKAGSDARAGDHTALTKATIAIQKEAEILSATLAGARTATEQRRLLHRTAYGGALAGAIMWATFAGVIARSLPESWHLPERMAARTVRLDMWQAGGRLMDAANPDDWKLVLQAHQLMSENRQAIGRCEGAAAKRQTNVTCTITIAARNRN